MNGTDQEIWEATRRRFDEVGRLVAIPPWPAGGRSSGIAVVRRRAGPPSDRRSLSGAMALVAVIVVIAVAAVGILNRPGERPGGAGAPAPSPSATSTTSATAAGSDSGCGPSHIGTLVDEGFVPYEGRFGYNGPRLGQSGKLVESLGDAEVTAYRAILPTAKLGDRSLAATVWGQESQQVTLVYSAHPVSLDATLADLARDGAIVVTELRDDGSLNAAVVLQTVTRNRWLVRVGPHPAALVWGDPVAEGVRPFGLHWADGERWWTMTGVARPDDLIDFARSIYC